MTPEIYEPAVHYDRVTEAWGLLLGEELHYGVFATGDEPLDVATGQLTTLMIQAAQFAPGQRLLDIGCGSGAPACRLAADFGVGVLGITTSQVGVDKANARAVSLGLDAVSFERRDGTANGLQDASFDRVWALESSHLMADRRALIAESARVLRPGGRFILCDVIRRREIPFAELRARQEDFAILRAGFGAARMDTLDQYAALAHDSGLVVDHIVDLTAETLATFDRWQANADEHHDAVLDLLGPDNLDAFVKSLPILDGLWRDGTLGYGLFSASKPL